MHLAAEPIESLTSEIGHPRNVGASIVGIGVWGCILLYFNKGTLKNTFRFLY